MGDIIVAVIIFGILIAALIYALITDYKERNYDPWPHRRRRKR